MRALYHATTYENFLSIIKNGFNPKLTKSMVWTVSEQDCMYFYDFDRIFAEDFHNLASEINRVHNRCLKEAFLNSSITASLQNSNFNTLVAFRLLIEDKNVHEDFSCGMPEASQVYLEHLSLDTIDEIYFSHDLYDPRLRFGFMPDYNESFNLKALSREDQRELEGYKENNKSMNVFRERHNNFSFEKINIEHLLLILNFN